MCIRDSDHTQEDEPAVLTFKKTEKTVFSAVSMASNVQGPEDGFLLRGEGSMTSSDDRDSEDNTGRADSYEEFMRIYGNMSIDDFD